MTLKIIGGAFKGRKIETPRGETTRPTQSVVREALFNICQNEIVEASFLDGFAGSGAIGLEALSRGAKHCTFIEKDRKALQCLEKNLDLLGVKNKAQILKMSVEKALRSIEESFDIIYLDPPYAIDPLPILKEIRERHLLSSQGTLFLETSQDLKTVSFFKQQSLRRFASTRLYAFQPLD